MRKNTGGIRRAAVVTVSCALMLNTWASNGGFSGGGQGLGAAATNSWLGSGGDLWQSNADWSLGTMPQANQYIYITNANTKTVTLDATTVSDFPTNMTIASLAIGAPDTAVNTLLLNNPGVSAPLTINRDLTIGRGGALVVSNGVINQNLLSGVTIDGNLALAGGSMQVGAISLSQHNAGAAATVTDGLLSSTSFQMGNGYADNNATMLISGPTAVWSNSTYIYVGNLSANNQLTINNGGQVQCYQNGAYGGIGMTSDATNNSVTVSGSGSLWKLLGGTVAVGYNGAGNQMSILDGGQVNSGNGGCIGLASGDNTVLVSGQNSVWNNGGSLQVGNSGTNNQLLVSNAGLVNSTYGYVGYNADNNLATISGSGSVWSNTADLMVGVNSSANQLTISAGGQAYSANGCVGYYSTGNSNVVTLTGTGSLWQNSGTLTVGWSGNNNQLTVTNGAQLISAAGVIGADNNDGNNLVTVGGAGSAWTVAGSLTVASNGWFNDLTITDGGLVVASNLMVSPGPSIGYGGVTVQAGGRLIATNGTSVIGGTNFVFGGVNINAGGYMQLKDVVVADSTYATTFININNGTNEILGNLTLGNHVTAEGQGSVSLNGGLLVVTNGLTVVGNSGRGSLSVSDGTFLAKEVHVAEQASTGQNPIFGFYGGQSLIAGQLLVANGVGSFASGIQSGGLLTASNEVFGNYGYARFSQTGGTNLTTSLVLGAQASGVGSYELDGGILTATNEYIGQAGNGYFAQYGGTNTVIGTLQIGAASGNLGTYALYGGKLTANNGITIMPTGVFTNYGGDPDCTVVNQGSLVHLGGPFNALLDNQGSFTMAADFAPSEGVINHTSMTIPVDLTLSANGAGFDNRGTLALAGGTLAGSGPLTNSGFVAGYGAIDNQIDNAGLIQATNGLLTLTGPVANGAAGTLRADTGSTLKLNTGLSDNLGLITLYGGTLDNNGHALTNSGTLAGNGTLIGSVLNNATIAPGHSPGLLNIVGDLTLGTNSTLAMQLAGTSSNLYDRLTVSGALSYDGDLQLSLIDGFDPAAGETFDLFNFTTESGAFTSTELPALDPGLAWDTSRLLTNGELSVVAIPEPVSLAVMLLSCGLLYQWRKRR